MISTHLSKTSTRSGALSLFAVLAIVAASSSASAQLAGATAEPEPAAKPAKGASRGRSTSLNAAPGGRAAAAPASALVLAQDQPSYGPAAQGTAPITSVSVMASALPAAPGADRNTCIPDCRSGFVCREGECVSACNPQCGEGEMCNARRECVARTESQSTESHPYDAVRFGVGGQIGVGSSTDGTGTGYGGHITMALPLGGHFYSREDIIATYFRTSTNDDQVIGPSVSPYGGQTTIDQTYLLVALRATVGYQFGSFVSARAGALIGSHTLTAVHGYCGTGPQSHTFNSFAAGGTGALAFAMKHFDLSVVADVYSADTQAICGVVPGPYGATAPATLVSRKDVAAQFLAQGTFLF